LQPTRFDLVVEDFSVWARPVGVAVAHDGALLVSEDGNGTICRISYPSGPIKTDTAFALLVGRVRVSDLWVMPREKEWQP
jgi:hypothetical protein